VQQLKCIEEELCIEWTWRTEHKEEKNKKNKACVQEGSEVDRERKCNRIVISLVSHY
jgi:hypothetical protein